MPNPNLPQNVFYIQSYINNSDWVLARTADNKVHLEHKDGSIRQLWTREDDARGGMFIKSMENDYVLNWGGGRGAPVTLTPKNLGDAHQLWVPMQHGGSQWNFIYAANWNQALNAFGYPPYNEKTGIGLWEGSGGQGNELWMLAPENGAVVVESIQYDMSAAKVNLDMAPKTGAVTAVDNRGGTTTLETAVKLTRNVSTTRQFTYNQNITSTVKIAQQLGYKLSVEKVVEVSSQVAIENTLSTSTSITNQQGETTSNTDELQVSVKVPPGGRYEYMVRVHYGTVSVPFTATIVRKLPNGQDERTQVSGTYRNVNMVKYDVFYVGNDASGAAVRPLQGILGVDPVAMEPVAVEPAAEASAW